MGWIALGIVANVLRTYAIYRFMRLAYLKKRKFCHEFVIYILFVLLTSGGYYLLGNSYINIITNVIGLFLITLEYEGGILKNILVIFSIYSVNVVIESLVFVSVGMNNNSKQFIEAVNECVTSIGILLFVTVLEKTQALKKKEVQFRFILWGGLISVPIISILIILILLNWYGLEQEGIIIEIIGILLINLIIFYLYGEIQDYCVQEIEKEKFIKKAEIYGHQLEVMKESYQKVCELRHDMKHHLIELRYLAETNENEKLKKYLNEMETHMHNQKEYVLSGNREIDGTLNYLLRNARRILKDVQVNVVIPENLEIHNYLFNTILGNLIENAIISAEQTERKYMRLDIKFKHNIIYIKIENSFNGEIAVKGQELLTTQKESEGHGIGLKSVKRIVDEMNGIMNIKWEKKLFCVDVTFYKEVLKK